MEYEPPPEPHTHIHTATPIHDQAGSKLMQLPQEIRDEIYSHLFYATRLISGERIYRRTETRSVISAFSGNALAILRTCHRVKNEIGESWLAQVLLSFEDPKALLNKLANISIDIRKRIRHVRVSGQSLMLQYNNCDPDEDKEYSTTQVLKLLPGLNLDKLTVLGLDEPETSLETLNMLIHWSNGWKELRYISPNASILRVKDIFDSYHDPVDRRFGREFLRTGWRESLEQRDGKHTMPSVEIYCSTRADIQRLVLKSDETPTFIQDHSSMPSDCDRYEGQALVSSAERTKEFLVLVKRGKGTDSENAGSPYLLFGDIREDKGHEWKVIKAEHDARPSREDDDPFQTLEELFSSTKRKDESIVDSYKHVDEYTW